MSSEGFVDFSSLQEVEPVERDCRIVGPAAESLFVPGEYGKSLQERFLQEARGIPPDPMPAVADDKVRLVIIDSVQDDSTPEGRECPAATKTGKHECSPHGEILVKLARNLLCEQEDCAAKITARRVLRWTHVVQATADSPPDPYRLDDKDANAEVQGGFSGTTEDLATAIRREVEAWWNEEDTRPRLILNLSVGWESIQAADSPMVRAAIQDAVCRGVLVIAAAGNRVAGPAALNTPLLPAAWEQEPAPTEAKCEALLEEEATPQPAPVAGTYAPLLYAVGGVQQDDRLLSNARPNSTPRLVAFGDHAPALYPPKFPTRHETLTGTSVSAVVVSAAAAFHWSKNPGSSSFEVMQELWQANEGNTVPSAIDFCWQPETNCSPPEKPRRIYVHDEPEEAAKRWPEGMPVFDDAAIQSALQDGVMFGDLVASAELADCDPRHLDSMVGLDDATELCPQRLYDVAVQPALGPQPGPSHNPDCGFTKNSPGTLLLQFDRRYRIEGVPTELSDFTLFVKGKAYRLNNDKPVLGEENSMYYQIVITGLAFEDPYPMYLATTVNGKHATITPILLVEK